VQFGRPISGFQLTQQKLADMSLEVLKALLLALHLGRLKDLMASSLSKSASAS
jgi:glutaryl-CoA dehydrogenase